MNKSFVSVHKNDTLNSVISFAEENNIHFSIKHGINCFHYTEIVFENEKVAWKVYKKLQMKCTGPLVCANGKFGFRYYV